MKLSAKKKMLVLIAGIIVIILGTAYFCMGFFVVQPIGAIPEGITILYVRAGTNFPFIVSPDSYSLEKTGSVSLMSRGVALGSISEAIHKRILLRLPYAEGLYNATIKEPKEQTREELQKQLDQSLKQLRPEDPETVRMRKK
ncbi:hypothetical protein FACS1894137_17790 [Spirochaetia bacterium]|nr:hypothetical protein FACS1894137_17790 [Spirochaetia bacterium]